MAGRFVLQKLASRMSRSTRLLSAHASASARATTPVIPGASEAGIRTLSNVFLRAAAHPGRAVPGSHVLHGCGARYLNTNSEAAKTSWSKTGMPDSVGVKPTGSSGTSIKLQLTDWAARVKARWLNFYEADPVFVNMLLLFALGVVICVPTPSEYREMRRKVPVVQCSGCCNCIGSRSKS